MTTAFVLGGGGVLGAVEVGMLRALLERDVRPDLVLGTSIGAFNGALVAREPEVSVVTRLTELWQSASASGPLPCRAAAPPVPGVTPRERGLSGQHRHRPAMSPRRERKTR